MTKPNDGGPAFPVPDGITDETNGGRTFTKYGIASSGGMSLRCYIATAALQGILADSSRSGTKEDRASYAVQCADALIAELNKEGK